MGGSRWARRSNEWGTVRLRLAALLAILALAVAGCGGGDDDGGAGGSTGTTQAASACADQKLASTEDVTLILDFLPNPVHIAIYQGLATGTYKANNINLKVQTPTSTSDTLRLLATDRADIGIVSLLDFLTSYQQQQQPITAFMALEQRPLGSLLALEKSGVTSPKDLEGKTVGVTGVPSDLAAVNSMVTDAGGDPTKVKTVTIGFNAVQNLIGGKVDAAVGFWNAEGVQLQAQEPTRIFKLDEFGAPPYPELVAFTRNDTIQENPALICAFVKATVEGYASATANPDQALDNLTKQAEGLALSDAKAQYEALKPVYQADAPTYGALDLAVLADYLTWAKEAKILDLSDDPSKFATDQFTAGA